MSVKQSRDAGSAAAGWKRLLAETVLARGNKRRAVTSADLAEQMNIYLARLGVTDRVKASTVRHYRTMPSPIEKASDRAPRSTEMANAFVWALEDLGAWRGVDDQVASAEEQRRLIEDLGFERLNRPPPIFAEGPYGVVHLLESASSTGDASSLVLQIHSSIGFFTAEDQAVAAKVRGCLRHGMRALYVARNDWGGYERMVSDLKFTLRRVFAQEAKGTQRWTDQVYVLGASDAGLPSIATLFCRIGIVSQLAERDRQTNGLDAGMLYRSNVLQAWVEVTTELSSRLDLNASKWLSVQNVGHVQKELADWSYRCPTDAIRPLFPNSEPSS